VRNNKPLFVAIIAAIFLGLFFGQAALGITLLQPSGFTEIPAARDYATEVLRDPWDMSNKQDIVPHLTKHFSRVKMSNGVWRGTTINRDSRFWFLFSGYYGSYANGREGAANPVNTAIYKRLTFKMYLGVSSTAYRRGTFYWFYDKKLRKHSHIRFKLKPGWHTYKIDLPSTWRGWPTSLRLDPIDRANTRVIVDWIRLTNRPSTNIHLRWVGAVKGSNVTVFLDNDRSGYNGTSLATFKCGSGSCAANVSFAGLEPGTYFMYLYNNGALSNYSLGGVIVNDAPRIKVVDPDKVGGRDWARTALRNSWDMRSPIDINKAFNIGGVRFRRGLFRAYNVQRNSGRRGTRKHDPYIMLNLRRKTINTRKYHRLTFRYRFRGGFSLKRGTMTRVGWITKRYNDPKHWQISDDIVTYAGWNTITIDLKKIKLNRGSYGWRNRVTQLRFDPHEDRRTRSFFIDYITLRQDDKVGSRGFVIRYNLYDKNDNDIAINIYRDRDRRFGNGNEALITSQRVGPGKRAYRWRPAHVIKGTFWIYVQANDGVNTSGYYSTGPLRVRT